MDGFNTKPARVSKSPTGQFDSGSGGFMSDWIKTVCVGRLRNGLTIEKIKTTKLRCFRIATLFSR